MKEHDNKYFIEHADFEKILRIRNSMMEGVYILTVPERPGRIKLLT
jgi:hypothetical protein